MRKSEFTNDDYEQDNLQEQEELCQDRDGFLFWVMMSGKAAAKIRVCLFQENEYNI